MVAGEGALALIKEFEGFRADPYKCPAGYWTVGYGCRFRADGTPVRKADACVTEAEAEEMLASCLGAYEAAVEDAVTAELTQQQFDALVSFTYNVGVRAFCQSTLLKRINPNPNDPRIKDEFMRWTKVRGTVSKGLERRRRAESKLYFTKPQKSERPALGRDA
jgi:lysozyme